MSMRRHNDEGGGFGTRIKRLRRYCGLTQRDAAELLGIARTTLIQYENNAKPIPLSVLVQMTELYECTVFDIFGVRTPPNIEYDISPYYLLKANARINIIQEMDALKRFASREYGGDFFRKRYKRYTLSMIDALSKYPGFAGQIKEMRALANGDDFEL